MRPATERAAQIALAAALDLGLGDPPNSRHPVRWLGNAVSRLEGFLYDRFPGRAGGALLVAATVPVALVPVATVMRLAGRAGATCRVVAGAVVISYCISFKTLRSKALGAAALMEEGRLEEARSVVAEMVGRDTRGLDSGELSRAAIESTAENASDGVVAPLFFAALGGPLAACLYRAINTLDSMVGYRDERYSRFGTAAARLDDLANFLPARITAYFMAASRLSADGRWMEVLRSARRFAPLHASPNAGWPEAAMASSLGVRLGGINHYGGVPVATPHLGDGTEAVTPDKVVEAAGVLSSAYAYSLAAILALAFLAGRRA